jgi:hypothetical protein
LTIFSRFLRIHEATIGPIARLSKVAGSDHR